MACQVLRYPSNLENLTWIIVSYVDKQNPVNKNSNSAGARCKIIEASKKLKDGLLDLLNEVEIQQIQFHPTTCYGAYTLKASRFKESVPAPEMMSS